MGLVIIRTAYAYSWYHVAKGPVFFSDRTMLQCNSHTKPPHLFTYLFIIIYFNSINKHSSSDVADYLETYRLHILHR